MSHTLPVGRRERNKQEKLARIIDAASELFTERGVDDVTTQEIAEKADIGTGTLFLYAKTKGELLLMVQNANYEYALQRGKLAADGIADQLEAIMAIIRPVVECNRIQVDNGRAYLREMVFGDPDEPHHSAALALTGRTEEAMSAVLLRDPRMTASEVATVARVISAVVFTTMAVAGNLAASLDDILEQIRTQIAVLVREMPAAR